MMNERQIEAELRLFKGYTISEDEFYDGKLKENAYGNGILFLEEPSPTVLEKALELYGKDEEKWNQTFHKSFSTVRDTPIVTLIAQQLIHYFTTYGLESLGLYNEDLVYIPHEQLDIPELEEDIPMIIIHKLSEQELKDKLMILLTSGIALSKETIADIMELSDYIDLDMVDDVKNREVKTALYEKYYIVPGNNVEFLRYLIRKVTGRTLLIKDKATIKALQEADTHLLWSELKGYVVLNGYYENNKFIKKLRNKYQSEEDKPRLTNGYEVLAKIFLRYKNLFLAMKRKNYEPDDKEAKQINSMINNISKLSKKYHEPLESNILDTLTQIKSKAELDDIKNDLIKELKNINLFRMTRIINSLSYRANEENTSILYKVRNGKGYVKEYNASESYFDVTNIIKDIVLEEYTKRIETKLKGKTVYIPDNIKYMVPQSEKQFMDNIPEGSYIEVPRESDMLVGIHWTNLDKDGYDGRVDLDLHMQNKNEQYGWNTLYRSSTANFFFSGDVTDAPKPLGATEVFYIGKNCENKNFLLTLNNYTANRDEVPFEFIIAKTNTADICKNFIVDPNNILTKVNKKFEYDVNGNKVNQITLGLVKIKDDNIRFYFNDFSLGTSIITRQNKITQGAYSYLESYSDTQMELKELIKPYVTLTDSPLVETLVETDQVDEDGNKLFKKVTRPVDYDLSLENISKETIIEMFTEV